MASSRHFFFPAPKIGKGNSIADEARLQELSAFAGCSQNARRIG